MVVLVVLAKTQRKKSDNFKKSYLTSGVVVVLICFNWAAKRSCWSAAGLSAGLRFESEEVPFELESIVSLVSSDTI